MMYGMDEAKAVEMVKTSLTLRQNLKNKHAQSLKVLHPQQHMLNLLLALNSFHFNLTLGNGSVQQLKKSFIFVKSKRSEKLELALRY